MTFSSSPAATSTASEPGTAPTDSRSAVGFIGTGLMGLPMAQRLLAANMPLVAYNRTADKLAPLRSTPARVATTVQEVLQSCSVVLLMLTDAAAIQDLLLAETSRPYLQGCTVIQMGTIAPQESQRIQEQVVAASGAYLEAPVLGSIPQAIDGTLQIMMGATPEQFQQWQSLLQHLGTPQHIGAVGSAAALKLALNQLIGSLTTAFALSLGFIQQQGVEVGTFMAILRDSALYAPTFDKKLQRMVEGDYSHPNFPTKHLLKDIKLMQQAAAASGLRLDSLEGVQQILQTACDMGLADADYSALCAAVQARSPL